MGRPAACSRASRFGTNSPRRASGPRSRGPSGPERSAAITICTISPIRPTRNTPQRPPDRTSDLNTIRCASRGTGEAVREGPVQVATRGASPEIGPARTGAGRRDKRDLQTAPPSGRRASAAPRDRASPHRTACEPSGAGAGLPHRGPGSGRGRRTGRSSGRRPGDRERDTPEHAPNRARRPPRQATPGP